MKTFLHSEHMQKVFRQVDTMSAATEILEEEIRRLKNTIVEITQDDAMSTAPIEFLQLEDVSV